MNAFTLAIEHIRLLLILIDEKPTENLIFQLNEAIAARDNAHNE